MRLLIKSNHNYIVKSENVLRGSSPQYCCSSPNNLYNCILLSRDEIAGHFFTPSENVGLLFAVGDSTAYFFYYEGGGNRVRSCLHAVENIVDDNYNNNRDIFIAELRCTTSACVLTAVSLWTDGRIACWHENEINKFPLTGRRENFLSVQMVSAWIDPFTNITSNLNFIFNLYIFFFCVKCFFCNYHDVNFFVV